MCKPFFSFLYSLYVSRCHTNAALTQVRYDYYRMCSLTIECVLLKSCHTNAALTQVRLTKDYYSDYYDYYRMCSLTIECVLLKTMLSITSAVIHTHAHYYDYHRYY